MAEAYQSLSHSNGTGSTTRCSCPNDGGRPDSANRIDNLARFFTRSLDRQKECQIIEGHSMPGQVHMCIAIPPKHPVASGIGFLKGKSAIAIGRLCGKERNFSGEHFRARGYAVSLPSSNWSRSAITSASRKPRGVSDLAASSSWRPTCLRSGGRSP